MPSIRRPTSPIIYIFILVFIALVIMIKLVDFGLLDQKDYRSLFSGVNSRLESGH